MIGEDPTELRRVSGAQHVPQSNYRGIRRAGISLARERVRPIGALVNPAFDQVDLLRLERVRGRHSERGLRRAHPAIEWAALAAARHDASSICANAVRQCVSAPVEAKSAHLL